MPGWVSTTLYRVDRDTSEYYITVVFDSKASYEANANSPEQDARYRRMVTLLESELTPCCRTSPPPV